MLPDKSPHIPRDPDREPRTAPEAPVSYLGGLRAVGREFIAPDPDNPHVTVNGSTEVHDAYAARWVRGGHTPGFRLDEGRIAQKSADLCAFQADGVTGHDGRALYLGRHTVSERGDLGGGFVVGPVLDRLSQHFFELPPVEIPAGNLSCWEGRKITCGTEPLYHWYFRDHPEINKLLEPGEGAPIKGVWGSNFHWTRRGLVEASGIEDIARVRLSVRQALKQALEEAKPEFLERFQAAPPGFTALACFGGIMRLPSGGHAVFASGDVQAVVASRSQYVAQTEVIHPYTTFQQEGSDDLYRQVASFGYRRTPEGVELELPFIISVRLIPPGLVDPTVLLFTDGYGDYMKDRSDFLSELLPHINEAPEEIVDRAEELFIMARQQHKERTSIAPDDRSLIVWRRAASGRHY